MLSSVANSRPVAAALTLAAFVATAGALRPLEQRAGAAPVSLSGRGEQWAVLAGQGHALAVLGGLRSVVANGCWLQTNSAWEKRDPVATRALILLTVAADERPLYFWLNGARMLACDLPEWRLTPSMPAAMRPRIDEEQAQQALQFLETGLRWHGPAPALYIEMANIHLRRRGDPQAAARYYRLAAEQPGAPYFAARIHAELLRELGRLDEALVWLQQILPSLPAADPLARRDVVVERISLLEREVAARDSARRPEGAGAQFRRVRHDGVDSAGCLLTCGNETLALPASWLSQP